MTEAEIADFLTADDRIRKFEEAHSLVHECVTRAGEQLCSNILKAMKSVADATAAKWYVEEYREQKYKFIQLVPAAAGNDQDPSLSIAWLERALLSEDAWIG